MIVWFVSVVLVRPTTRVISKICYFHIDMERDAIVYLVAIVSTRLLFFVILGEV